MAYNGENKRRWHLSREISIEGVMAVLATLALVGAAWVTFNERLGAVEIRQIQIGDRLNRIENKLDRVIERKQ